MSKEQNTEPIGSVQYRTEQHFCYRMKQYEKMKAEHDKINRTKQRKKEPARNSGTSAHSVTARKGKNGALLLSGNDEWAAGLLDTLNKSK